jgi:molecular chaperone DnaK (HSP70)
VLNCEFPFSGAVARMEDTVLGKAIGLDFGTTNSALAIAKPE